MEGEVPDYEVEEGQEKQVLGDEEEELAGVAADAAPLEASGKDDQMEQPVGVHEEDGRRQHRLVGLGLHPIEGVAQVEVGKKGLLLIGPLVAEPVDGELEDLDEGDAVEHHLDDPQGQGMFFDVSVQQSHHPHVEGGLLESRLFLLLHSNIVLILNESSIIPLSQ